MAYDTHDACPVERCTGFHDSSSTFPVCSAIFPVAIICCEYTSGEILSKRNTAECYADSGKNR